MTERQEPVSLLAVGGTPRCEPCQRAGAGSAGAGLTNRPRPRDVARRRLGDERSSFAPAPFRALSGGTARSGFDFGSLAIHADSAPAAGSLGAGPLPILQRAPRAMQPKLEIGAANDHFEQEADRVADHVMRTSAQPTAAPEPCAACAHDQRDATLQRLGATPTAAAGSVDAGVVGSTRAGTALPAEVRSFMEPRFGYDFGSVRVHPDHHAAPLLQARAFTVGADIFFAPGEFQPHSHGGRRIIGHELTHTIQQGAVPPLGAGGFERAPAAGPIRRTAPLIQREVSEGSVASGSSVLARIAARSTEADGHAAAVLRVLRALNAVIPTIPGTPAEIADLRAQIPEEAFGAVVGDLFRLGETGFLEFNPGAGRDSPQNAFVYTCTCGWIDMGHFFISATIEFALEVLMRVWSGLRDLLGGATAQQAALIIGWYMEHLQEAFRQIATGPLGGLVDSAPAAIRDAVMGNVRSAFTVEDLPSDAYGSRFGHQVAVSMATSLFGPEVDDIRSRMADFFTDCGGAVFPTGAMRRAMVDETIGPGPLPRQHFSTDPVLLTSAGGLCPAPESECPAVDERGWERAHPAGRITEEADKTTLWNFTVDVAALKPEHRDRLRLAAAAAPRGAMLMVEGYASCTGSSAHNERLARSRAETATTFLRTLRPDLRIGLNYHGERRPSPLVAAGDGEAMAKNRRVEIYVVDVPRGVLGIPTFELPGRAPLPGGAAVDSSSVDAPAAAAAEE